MPFLMPIPWNSVAEQPSGDTHSKDHCRGMRGLGRCECVPTRGLPGEIGKGVEINGLSPDPLDLGFSRSSQPRYLPFVFSLTISSTGVFPNPRYLAGDLGRAMVSVQATLDSLLEPRHDEIERNAWALPLPVTSSEPIDMPS